MSENEGPVDFVCFRDDGTLDEIVSVSDDLPLVAIRPIRLGDLLGVAKGVISGPNGPAKGMAPLKASCYGAAYCGMAGRDYAVGEVVEPLVRFPSDK